MRARVLLCGVTLALLGTSSSAQILPPTVRVYTQLVKAREICGTNYAKYRCSMTRRHMALNKSDISLQIEDGAPAYLDVLGMVYDDLSGNAIDLEPCGIGQDSNTFTMSNVTMSSPTPFTFRKTAQSELGVAASVDVKSALQAAGVPAGQLDQLQAEFESAYASKAASEFSMSGVYQRVALRTALTGAIKNKATSNAIAKACGDVLRKSDKALIYSVAVVKLDAAKYVSNVVDNLSVSFAAAVKAKAAGADLAKLRAGIKQEVNSSLTVSPGADWRVISWDYVQLDLE